jgi:cysteine desulfurase
MCDRPIYLDGHSTTPLDPRVLEAMLPVLREDFGNAASVHHAYGWKAADHVEEARAAVAQLLGADPKEIVFTSGATESNNLALRGVAIARRQPGGHIITAATEHPSVLDPLERLEREGVRVTRLPVLESGLIDHEALAQSFQPDTFLVSIMHANNETGVIQDIAAIGKLCVEHGVLFHTDATQSVGKIPVNVAEQDIHLLSLSAHKLYGPKGVGALYIRRRQPRVKLEPLIDGGGHERGYRSGTLNVPGIVGLGRAAQLALNEMHDDAARLSTLRNRLRDRLFSELDELIENGDPGHRLPHSMNVSIGYIDSVALLNELPGLAVSTGSACSSAHPEPSHVIRAMAGEERARSSVRFGLTRFTTEEEIDRAAGMLIQAVRSLRAHSPLYASRPGVSPSPG